MNLFIKLNYFYKQEKQRQIVLQFPGFLLGYSNDQQKTIIIKVFNNNICLE